MKLHTLKPYKFLFLIATIIVLGCDKKDSGSQPSSPAPEIQEVDEIFKDSFEQQPDSQLEPKPNTPTEPEPVEAPTNPSDLTNSVVTRLIEDIRQNKLLKESNDIQTTDKITRNLTLANTLEDVLIQYDYNGLPSLKIKTQEDTYVLNVVSQTQNSNTSTIYQMATEEGFISRIFSDSNIQYTATLETFGKFNNIARIELKRTSEHFDAVVHIAYFKKSGSIELKIPSRDSLSINSSRILDNLLEIDQVVGHFYTVITELDHLNSSQATQFSLFFDIYFSLHSTHEGYLSNDTMPLRKERIKFFDSYSLNALRQGHISSIRKAYYKTQRNNQTAVPAIELNSLLIYLDMLQVGLNDPQRVEMKITFE